MNPRRKAVGIDSANPGECASITDWERQGYSLCFFGNSSSVAEFENRRSCSVWICTARAIRKELNQNGQCRFSAAQFRQNDENSSSRPACRRTAEREGNGIPN